MGHGGRGGTGDKEAWRETAMLRVGTVEQAVRCCQGGSVRPGPQGPDYPLEGWSRGELFLKPVVTQKLHFGNGSGKTKYKHLFFKCMLSEGY